MHIDSIFKLTPYALRNRKNRHYPTCRLTGCESAYFRTREEAEAAMTHIHSHHWEIYCWVLSELPVGVCVLHHESFSERVYLPDGRLWSERQYADMLPCDIPAPYGEIEFDNYIYGRRFFAGRKPEEIRFQPGDIIEILCHPGNHYWGDGSVELAIVIDTPPTLDEIAKQAEHYLKTDEHLTGDRGFDLGVEFNVLDDAYAVVAAYVSADTEENPIDFCPTHCAMMPRIETVSTRMRNKLERLREKVMANEEWRKKLKRHALPC